MLTRRDMLRSALGGAAALAVPGVTLAAQPPKPAGPHQLPPLKYGFDALEPHVDAKTMEIHHDRHHATYVTNLNAAVAKAPDFANTHVEDLVRQLDKLPMEVRTAVRNNGGGHVNHTWFWDMMAPAGKGGEPKGELLKAIDDSFGGVDKFKAAFKAAALAQFGSGWAWLVPGGKDGKPLSVVATPNQDNPLMAGGPAPLLGVDVWEHAYYLKYQNKRADYVDAWFNVVNWNFVADRFAKAGKS